MKSMIQQGELPAGKEDLLTRGRLCKDDTFISNRALRGSLSYVTKKFRNVVTPTELKGFRVELGNDSKDEPYVAIPEDLYAKYYYPARHYNFVGKTSTERGDEYTVVSVLAVPQTEGYKALKNTKKGFEEFFIPESAVSEKKSASSSFLLTKEIVKKIVKYLESIMENTKFYNVGNNKFASELLKVEKKHPQDNHKCCKVAIVYCKANQKTPKEMFENSQPSEAFTDFLNIMGTKIKLDSWLRYKGDMGKSGESYFTDWKDWQVMYHVSPMMIAEQHRRLIGNDIAIIIFYDCGDSPLDVTEIDQFGTVPQVFAIVSPEPKFKGAPKMIDTQYRVGFLTRINVKPFGPELNKHRLYDKNNLKDWLLSKLCNGYLKALSCPPMNRLFYVPRAATLDEIISKFPPETEKEAKAREKQAKSLRRQLRITSSKKRDIKTQTLTVEVIRGRNLASKDANGFSDPYCVAIIEDQKFKTETVKKTLNPVWNTTFTFDLIGLDFQFTDFELRCKDWDRVGTHDPMGRVVIPLTEMKRYAGEEKWFQLFPMKEEKVEGEVLLKFTLEGVDEEIGAGSVKDENPL